MEGTEAVPIGGIHVSSFVLESGIVSERNYRVLVLLIKNEDGEKRGPPQIKWAAGPGYRGFLISHQELLKGCVGRSD